MCIRDRHKPFPTAAADAGTRTKAAILVFFGGACYGFNATCYKLSYAWGFSSAQIAAAQMWAGFALFAVFLFFNRARGERWTKLGCANILKLLGVGAATCITSIFYTYAMSVLPVALALTLLSLIHISSDCNVSVGTIYNHFASKGELTTATTALYFKHAFYTDFCHPTKGERYLDFCTRMFDSIDVYKRQH